LADAGSVCKNQVLIFWLVEKLAGAIVHFGAKFMAFLFIWNSYFRKACTDFSAFGRE
jgi:hypothetical protein